MEKISVRQWQEAFRAGQFDDKSFETQCKAGWYDWFCQDEALAGRLKKLAKVVMGITESFILDNYYVWFKNNCPLSGPLYDDVRFEPLLGERDGKYFLVTLDSPHEKQKWALITERHGFDTPEFQCANVRDMVKYINGMARELEQGVQPSFIAEKEAVERYLAEHMGLADMAVRREGGHCYSYYSDPKDVFSKRIIVARAKEGLPSGCDVTSAEEIGGVYVFGTDGVNGSVSREGRPPARKTLKRKGRER